MLTTAATTAETTFQPNKTCIYFNCTSYFAVAADNRGPISNKSKKCLQVSCLKEKTTIKKNGILQTQSSKKVSVTRWRQTLGSLI